MSSEKLQIVKGKSKGTEFPLSGSNALLGSDSECNIVIAEKGILPQHAFLENRGGIWWIQALDNGKPIDWEGRTLYELKLQHGTQFSIGQIQIRFVCDKAIIEGSSLPGKAFPDQAKAIEQMKKASLKIKQELGKIIIGQQDIIDHILVSLFARGHCLMIGVPGLAKTLLVRALSGTLDLDCKRIQFTPDLMPADITGINILEEETSTRSRRFRFQRGPVFTNILLADEINRTSPKTQSALLEAMQEQKVTVSGVGYDLPQPFLVLATQNPIEQEGTYPLPEAQLDRFMFCLRLQYPSLQEETKIISDTTRGISWEVERTIDSESILAFQHLVRQIPVSDHVAAYTARLVRATRPGEKDSLDFINRWVRWGAGPRAGQYLLLAAKAHSLLNGKTNVSCSDIKHFAIPVLRHRIFCNFVAASDNISSDSIVEKILDSVKENHY
ncbi:MAG: AAA family ATPase [Candidatus Brocadiae bacterium]|nr:AAA family ATPase [Candidatus Brocadiia bacterium]